MLQPVLTVRCFSFTGAPPAEMPFYAGLLAYGSSLQISFPVSQWMACAFDCISPITVAGPRRTLTCFPLSSFVSTDTQRT